MSEVILSVSGLVVRYSDHVVLDGAGVVIHDNERVGLVGRNGSGKSTFLRIASKELEPDSGRIVSRRNLVTGYLPQAFNLADDQTVHHNIMEGARRVIDWIKEYESITTDFSRSSELLDRIDHAGGWNIEHRIKSLITNLHAPEAGRMVGSLSGGEKRRVSLCRALLSQPEFLILDEPTNHLDTESIEWLEEFLRKYEGAVLFVTHDRYFLDRIATRIVEVSRGKFFVHEGNYTSYLAAKAEREAIEVSQDRGRQKFLKSELEWIRRGPRARRTKSQDRIQRFHEIASQESHEQDLNVELIIPPAPKLGNRVVELKDVSVEIDGRLLFSGLNFRVEAGSRIGIVGRNGLGKTTLLRIILGEVAPLKGTLEIGPRTQINYVDQGRLLIDEQKTIFQEVGENSEHVRLGDETISLRAYLRRFLFDEGRINTRISLLSGGERSRVILAKILKRGGNVLILDEPTNDLDLATLRLLEEALIAFEGAVLVVSHDRYFLNRVCNGILAFEDGVRITQHVGNYEYFAENRLLPPIDPAATKAQSPQPNTRAGTSATKMSYRECTELEGMENAILVAEAEASRIEVIFHSPDFYEKYGAKQQQLESDLSIAKHNISALYARWEELEKIRAKADASRGTKS